MKNFLYIVILILSISPSKSIETRIVHKIQNEIITNIDIKNEFRYLIALNNSLKELDKDKILNISNESIIREKIKKIEISKYFKKIMISENHSNILLKNIYSRLGLKSLDEFEFYLKDYELSIADVKKKITINALWNELIVKKYKNQIVIDEAKIKKKIIKNEQAESKEYQLLEIIFDVENKEQIKTKYKEIIKSVEKIGFKNSASIYSFSESAKIGGDIGWISENSLSINIKKNINNLKIGEITNPIILSNGILILKIVNTKNIEIMIDYETKLKETINYERNRQLNQYSKIYFNKVKKNLEIDG